MKPMCHPQLLYSAILNIKRYGNYVRDVNFKITAGFSQDR